MAEGRWEMGVMSLKKGDVVFLAVEEANDVEPATEALTAVLDHVDGVLGFVMPDGWTLVDVPPEAMRTAGWVRIEDVEREWAERVREEGDQASVMQDDLKHLLGTLEMPTGAQPRSPHEVMWSAIEKAATLVGELRVEKQINEALRVEKNEYARMASEKYREQDRHGH